MGNRAVITYKGRGKKRVGIYLHWNGGRDSVNGFLAYCKAKNFRGPVSDCYGMARLTQIISNFFGGGLSIGVDTLDRLDCDNMDNGLYIIDDDWHIVGRKYFEGPEQAEYDLYEMLESINNHQPKSEQLSQEELKKGYEELKGEYK